MKIVCPKCLRDVVASDVNMGLGAFFCRACNEMFPLTREQEEQIEQIPENFRIDLPPAGAWYEQSMDGETAGATTRHWGALFLIPFTMVWGGASLGAIFCSQGVNDTFSLMATLGGILFSIGTAFLLVGTLMTVCGKTTVAVSEGVVRVFTGIAGIGWRREFPLDEIRSVRIQEQRWRDSDGDSQQKTYLLLLRKAGDVKFGSGVNQPRREYLLYALRQMLQRANGGDRS